MLLARTDKFAEISIRLVRIMTSTEMIIYQSMCINQSERYQISEVKAQTITMLSQILHVVCCHITVKRALGVGPSTPINPFAFTGTSESWQMLQRTNTKGRHGGHISNTLSKRLHFLHISVGF